MSRKKSHETAINEQTEKEKKKIFRKAHLTIREKCWNQTYAKGRLLF